MKKIGIQLVSFTLLSWGVSAQNNNHFTYKIVNVSSQMKVVKPGLAKECDFQVNGNSIKGHYREFNGGKMLTESNILYDLAKNIRIAMYPDNTYNIECIDSIYKVNCELVSKGETKTIKGMKCAKYQMKTPVTVQMGSALYAFSKEIATDKYTFWITNDIQLDKQTNKIILGVFTKFLIAEFIGALVQIDYRVDDPKSEVDCNMAMVNLEHIKLDETQFVVPWKLEGKYKAVVPKPDGGNDKINSNTHTNHFPAAANISNDANGNNAISNSTMGQMSFTSYKSAETSWALFKRHQKLLAEITGNPDLKFIVKPLVLLE